VVLTTPILEGLDGVNKMSKSLGNAIGIHEPPLEMYGKIMSISDDMMWRYYELLTDVRSGQIAQMKQDAASGKAHPMALKKELARAIAADFHSAEAAAKAAEDWAKQFQKDEVPKGVAEIVVSIGEIGGSVDANGMALLRLDRLLVRCGLAESGADAVRKLKQGAVRVENQTVGKSEPRILLQIAPRKHSLRVGKQLRIVTING